jgi:predicted nucleic acid-binding protein
MRIDLDTCCLNRPFDDHSQERIRREAAVVIRIIESARRGEHQLIRSEQHDAEVNATADPNRRSRTRAFLALAAAAPPVSQKVIVRSEELVRLGFDEADALHLSFAEESAADVFLTVDDRLVRRARRHSARIMVAVDEVLAWSPR